MTTPSRVTGIHERIKSLPSYPWIISGVPGGPTIVVRDRHNKSLMVCYDPSLAGFLTKCPNDMYFLMFHLTNAMKVLAARSGHDVEAKAVMEAFKADDGQPTIPRRGPETTPPSGAA